MAQVRQQRRDSDPASAFHSSSRSSAQKALAPPSPLFRPGSSRGGSAAPLQPHARSSLPGLSPNSGGNFNVGISSSTSNSSSNHHPDFCHEMRRPSTGNQRALPPFKSIDSSASSSNSTSSNHMFPGSVRCSPVKVSSGFAAVLPQRGPSQSGAVGRSGYGERAVSRGSGGSGLGVHERLSRITSGLETGGGFGHGSATKSSSSSSNSLLPPSAWAVGLMERYNLSPGQRPQSRRCARDAALQLARIGTANKGPRRPMAENGGLGGVEPPQWQ